MSEPGPESIPTSADSRSKRPTKRRAVTPHSEHASQISSLFRDPSKEIQLPEGAKPRTSSSLAAPPEIVANVQGSSAGAGSGEFHVYKASRRREYERLRMMQAETDKEKGDEEWEKMREETRMKDDEKTEKNRRRREKKRAAKGGKGGNGNNKRDAGGNLKGQKTMDVDKKVLERKDEDDTTEQVGGPAPQEEAPGVIIHEDD
ncbi:hypothetical protein N7474_004151 [Penicillium riverlandense]|uniref:uncharacterized protein n=1 Tax=Penicillium riverlandense TaxID=1903569 RepID=UPI0025481E15|nr:uncharacterized protein N7474_004151 [Penicillium riverlandense]KAJ5818560.1 hypothetical protein N7474_004151 [Penicillium riverlandense]